MTTIDIEQVQHTGQDGTPVDAVVSTKSDTEVHPQDREALLGEAGGLAFMIGVAILVLLPFLISALSSR